MIPIKRKVGFKKACLVILTGLSLVICASGCTTKQEWAFKLENETISEGEYVNTLNDVLIEAGGKFAQGGAGTKPDWDRLKSAPTDTIKERVNKDVKRKLLIKKVYKELSPDEVSEKIKESELSKDVNKEMALLKDKFNTELIGLNEDSIRDKMKGSFQTKAVYNANFGEGKPRYVSEERQKDFVVNNFVKYKVIKISKDADDPKYCEANDKQPGSKLESVAGVKTPQELVEKYMKEIEEGKTIDDINKEYGEITGSKDQELKFEVEYKEDNDNKKLKPLSDSEIKKLANELEIDASPELKENEKEFFIMQRYNLDDKDIEDHLKEGSSILNEQEVEKFMEELEQQYNDSIEVNDSVIQKYDVSKQISLLKKADKRPKKSQGMGGMFPGLF